MKKTPIIYAFLFGFIFSIPIFSLGQLNTIQGKITMPKPKSEILQASDYQDRIQDKESPETREITNQNDPDKHVIVSAHPLSFTPKISPTPNARITQRAKTFIPPVLAVTQGSTVYFLNEDEFFHNIYSRTPRASFNIGRRPPGNSYSQSINKAGVVKLFCDIHAQMGAVVLSLDTPYFTKADPAGNYRLSQLPDGEYRLEVFHLNHPKTSIVISVKNGQTLSQNFDLSR